LDTNSAMLADDPQLTCRLKHGKDPIRIVVDSKLSISGEAKILNLNSQAPTIIATTENAPSSKYKQLAKKAEVLVVNEGDRVDLVKLFKILGKRKITSVLVEGGATLNGTLLTEKLVDKLHLFYAPMLIGGKEAPGFIGGIGPARLEDAIRLENLQIETFGKDFVITAYPNLNTGFASSSRR